MRPDVPARARGLRLPGTDVALQSLPREEAPFIAGLLRIVFFRVYSQSESAGPQFRTGFTDAMISIARAGTIKPVILVRLAACCALIVLLCNSSLGMVLDGTRRPGHPPDP